MQRVAIICLGAFGDCCNALPIALYQWSMGNHVTFFIAKEFSSLLDGVTYCDREIWDGHYSEPLKAAEFAESSGKYDRIMIVQCYGTPVERQTDSFCKEAWALVGMLQHWGKLRLWFDNRNQAREFALYNGVTQNTDKSKRTVFVSHSGKSSPFPLESKIMLLSVLDRANDFNVVDISDLKAERFYDVLVLLENAACLITIDSGLLHLANAAPSLPVIALVTDRPDMWHGSPAQPNHVLRIRYGDFPTKQSYDKILETLSNIASKKRVDRRIVHVWNDYPYRSQDAAFRHETAKASWEAEYKKGRWIPCCVPDAQLTRNANQVGEQKPLPFVNDVINVAADQAQPDDLICLTNDDTIFVNDITERLLHTEPPFWSSRWEHGKVNGPLNSETIKKNSWKHVGSDVFVFTKRWWMEHSHEFPDFIISREAWDLCLRSLINLHGGHEEDALCAHIIHDPEWHSAQHRESVSNLFNRESARRFFREHNMRWPSV